mmetsp:Transcript_81288/g.204528  ORF Transcript_81288/g.204528 Transcript_81288/m.204528 type:complete len:223 (-) Transcript_81288:479-1147(-)
MSAPAIAAKATAAALALQSRSSPEARAHGCRAALRRRCTPATSPSSSSSMACCTASTCQRPRLTSAVSLQLLPKMPVSAVLPQLLRSSHLTSSAPADLERRGGATAYQRLACHGRGSSAPCLPRGPSTGRGAWATTMGWRTASKPFSHTSCWCSTRGAIPNSRVSSTLCVAPSVRLPIAMCLLPCLCLSRWSPMRSVVQRRTRRLDSTSVSTASVLVHRQSF